MYPDGIRPQRPAQLPSAASDPKPGDAVATAPSAPSDPPTAPATPVDEAARKYDQAQDNLDSFNRTWSAQAVRNDPDLQELRAGYQKQVDHGRGELKQAIEAEIKAGYQREFDARPTGAVYDGKSIEFHGRAIAERYAGDPQMQAQVEALVLEIKTDHEVNSTLQIAQSFDDPRQALSYLGGAMPGLSPQAQQRLAGNEEIRGWRQQLGQDDGEAVAKAWTEFQDTDPQRPDYLQKREALRTALDALRANGGDATYAEAALKAIGAQNLHDIVGVFPPDIRADNPYLTPGNFDFVKDHFGPLAQLVASADRGGVLPGEIRQALLNTGIAELAVFLRSSPQTEGLMRDALQQALQRAGSPLGQFALQQLMVGMDQHPRLMQELLADPKSREQLFDTNLFGPDRGTNYEADLARALGAALTPGRGDAQLQQQAWTGLIGAAQDGGFRGKVNDHPQLAQAMAEQFKVYLPWAANRQAQEYSANYGTPSLAAGAPTLSNQINVDQLTNFLGVLSSDPKAMQSLLDETARLFQQGGLAGLTPELLSQGNALQLQGKLASDFSLYALVMSGLTRADIDEQDRRDAMADAMKTLVVGYGLMLVPGTKAVGPLIDVALSQFTTPLSKDLAGFLQKLGDGQQVDGKQMYELTTRLVRESVEQRLAQLAPGMPADERKGLVNDIMNQFDSTTLREMIEEFWKGIN
ncbi:hypothetical protein K4L06_04330 [Lysobacter sp. BMK333-48F3]|uniref:hypothetical protein n=1 Tax=Lysobacter sp. BMK333-48F3 TaxID=2867962 RepID=UPI001C8B9DC8|nr:hypothetical protein [Lysobacter sp. BMK333-48F3]MBX9400528.1 hypothetical protein [Lysobacter sp. BMK333-48F3]